MVQYSNSAARKEYNDKDSYQFKLKLKLKMFC